MAGITAVGVESIFAPIRLSLELSRVVFRADSSGRFSRGHIDCRRARRIVDKGPTRQ